MEVRGRLGGKLSMLGGSCEVVEAGWVGGRLSVSLGLIKNDVGDAVGREMRCGHVQGRFRVF